MMMMMMMMLSMELVTTTTHQLSEKETTMMMTTRIPGAVGSSLMLLWKKFHFVMFLMLRLLKMFLLSVLLPILLYFSNASAVVSINRRLFGRCHSCCLDEIYSIRSRATKEMKIPRNRKRQCGLGAVSPKPLRTWTTRGYILIERFRCVIKWETTCAAVWSLDMDINNKSIY